MISPACHDAYVNCVDGQGDNALHKVAKNGSEHWASFVAIVNAGADATRRNNASETSLSKTVEYFLNGFGDACGEHVKLRDFAGRTALHHFTGCEQFDVRIVRMLVGPVPEAGRAGFVDAADNDSNTAVRLMRSKEGGQGAVEFLVKAGGQVPQ